MIIKVVENNKKVHRKYPYLGLYNSNLTEGAKLIVLFSEKSTGVVVYVDKLNTRSIGDFRPDWDEELFELFDKTLTLEND